MTMRFLPYIWPVLCLFACTAPTATDTNHMEHAHTNALVHETSPYLLQHAHNPVNWYPWNDSALAKAQAENKLIVVSVGYAACHWCHVMEHESFEDSTVAEVMNEHYVSIKVDREERPDIDQIYMTAVQLMTQRGGWPMNVVCLPDGRPIWGGTYFPKENWIDALLQLKDLWANKPGDAFRYAESLTDGIKRAEEIISVKNPQPFAAEDLEAVLEPWRASLDLRLGGRGQAPKFPIPNNWEFLTRVAQYGDEPHVQEAVDITLKKMAWGGIYDQLGGGFARYSVDPYWKVPHFEKMTYDNGQLVSLYADAYRRDPQPLYKEVVYQTLEFNDREMTSPEGGFYSSLDADSEGEEGKFYVWTKAEIYALLGEDAAWFGDYYGVTERGNWEHRNNVLIIDQTKEAYAESLGWSVEEFDEKLQSAKAKLFEARAERIRPGLDDKILTSWNALMLKGYVDAYIAFDEPAFLETALRNAHFIEDKLRNGDQLFRNYKEGRATINAFLDDYALLADAYLHLYRATADPHWLNQARGLIDYTFLHFYSGESQMFYYTSDLDPKLIARKMEVMDNVIPASNSVLANTLFELGHLFGEKRYLRTAEQMLQNVRADMPKYGSGYSNWGLLLLKYLHPYREVVVAGPHSHAFLRELTQHDVPNALFVAASEAQAGQLPLLEDRFVEGETRIYVCENNVCQLPVTTVEAALKQLQP